MKKNADPLAPRNIQKAAWKRFNRTRPECWHCCEHVSTILFERTFAAGVAYALRAIKDSAK